MMATLEVIIERGDAETRQDIVLIRLLRNNAPVYRWFAWTRRWEH